MNERISNRMARLLSRYQRRRESVAALALASVFIVFGVVMALRSTGVAASHTETVLDCQATGLVAHSHDESCFDAAGNLVCPLPEVGLHRHTEDCYVEAHELDCGMGEHAHGPECYDSEGALVCELPEHAHGDDCYESQRLLVCGQDEVTEEHVHGDGCLRTIEVPDEVEPDDGMAYGSEVTGEPGEGADEAADLAEADTEAADEMPAQRFTHSIRDAEGALVLRVDVDAPEGALPAGTTMAARWVEAGSLSRKQQAAVANAVAARAEGAIYAQQAVDVKFQDPTGAEVKPGRRVAVTLTSAMLDTEDLPVVAHIADLTDDQLVAQAEALRSGATADEAEPMRRAEALDRLSDGALSDLGISLANNQVAVACDEFSTFVINLTTLGHSMRAEGETVRVEVDAPAAAGLPADAELRVSEVAQGTPEHASYEADALAAAGAERASLSRFFDIKVVRADGAEVEPQAPVKVRIKLSDAPAGRPSSVVHFQDGAKAGEAPELVPSEVNNLTTKFEAEGFSVWGVVYTVDFEYELDGEVFKYSIPGEGSVKLSELFAALGVQANVADVKFVEFSNPELVSVSGPEEDGDWTLTSLAPFDTEEQLTVTLVDGQVFTVKVTDAAEEEMKTVTVNKAWANESGATIAWPGDATVEVTLKRRIVGSDGDFGNVAGLDAVTLDAETPSAEFTVPTTDGGEEPQEYEYQAVEVSGVDGYSPVVTGEGDTFTITNYAIETVDVPVDKTWQNDHGVAFDVSGGYTWTAKMVLEEKLVHEDGPTYPGVNTMHWRTVSGKEPLVVSSDSSATNQFDDLPKYRIYPNGAKYRIQYSLDEMSYNIKHNGMVISSWDKEQGLIDGEEIFLPSFVHDAGDVQDGTQYSNPNDANFYHVIVVNTTDETTVTDEYDNITITKEWEDGALEEAGVTEQEAFASFKLNRSVTEVYHEYVNPEPDTSCTVRLYKSYNGNELFDEKTYIKGSRIRIAATASGNGGTEFVSGNQTIRLSHYSGGNDIISDDLITVTGDIDIRPGQYSGLTNWISSAQLTDIYDRRQTEPDKSWNGEDSAPTYRLQSSNNWMDTIHRLPARTESSMVSVDGGNTYQKTVKLYTYYFEEDDSNPEGFYSTYTDVNTGQPLGDIENQISESNANIVATNKPIPPFEIKKVWYNDLLPDYFPEVRVSLYQGVIQNGNIQQGSLYDPNADGHFQDIPLNRENGWTWTCDKYLPTKNTNGQDVGYYIVENSNGNNVVLYDMNGNPITLDNDHQVIRAKIGQGNSNGYYNSTDSTAKANGWEAGLKTNTGTLFVSNQTSKNYTQFDVSKKIIEYVDDGSGSGNLEMQTTTAYPSRMRNSYIELQVMRLTTSEPTYDNGRDEIVLHDWEDYGKTIVVGYDANGNQITRNTNPYSMDKGTSAWMWDIEEDMHHDGSHSGGLPTVGFYLDSSTGEYRQVYYYYLLKEVGAYTDPDLTIPMVNEGYEWYIALEPEIWGASRVVVFPKETGQDQDRIMNIQASNLIVEKDWTDSTDVEEVYIKIYRTPKSSQNVDDMQGIDDVTWDIAQRTEIYPGYGIVPDENISTSDFKGGDNTLHHGGVLVLRPNDGPITIGQILFRDPNNNKEFQYYIQEVGYKDKYGVIRSIEEKFVPQYDQWDRNTGEWKSDWQDNPTDNMIKIGTRNNNKLRVRDVPTVDINIQKKWYDEDGNELTGPWAGLTPNEPVKFKVFQTKQQYVNGEPTGEKTTRTLKFGTSEELTIESVGKLLQVIVRDSGGDTYTVEQEAAPTGTNSWTTIVDGLQKHYIDAEGHEYRFTYEVQEVTSYQNCTTTITNNKGLTGGETVVISNHKEVTSLLIEKDFDGGVELTDDQKKKVTFTVIGPSFSKTFRYGVDGDIDGNDTNRYKWIDGTMLIKDIAPGYYTVTEQNDGVSSVFEGDMSGKTYVHSRKFTVGTTESTDSATAVVVEDSCTQVLVTNTYDELHNGSLKLKKLVTVNGTTTTQNLADGTYAFTITSGQDVSPAVSKTVTITVTGGEAVSAQIGDSSTQLSDAELDDDRYVLVTDLPAGTYVITEAAPENGTELASARRGDDAADAVNLAARTVSVVVVAGDDTAAEKTAQAEFTNNITNVTVLKVDAETGEALTGAKFQMTVQESGGSQFVTFENDAFETVGTGAEAKKSGPFEVEDATGKTIGGLAAGIYKLEETHAPDGYIISEDSWTFTVAANGTVSSEDKNSDGSPIVSKDGDEVIIKIENTPGAELPHSGGPGTTVLTIAGIAMVLAGAVSLLRRRVS